MPRAHIFNAAVQRRVALGTRLIPRYSRPVLRLSRHPQPRHFTQRPSLLIISRTAPRPQVPFLYSGSSRNSNPSSRSTRHISDDRKARLKALIRWNIRLVFSVGTAFILGTIIYNGLEQIRCERKYPTPPEWSFWARWYLRNGKIKEYEPRAKINGVATDWRAAGVNYLEALSNLEDGTKDGTNLVRRQWDNADGINGGGDILIDGIGSIGFDVRAKNEEWRRGYYESLMGAARAAEHLDGMAKSKGEKLPKAFVIPWASVLSPDNPRPKKLPWDKNRNYEKVHKAEDMEDAYKSPEYFYMRVLTTDGFTTRQRMDAALAYADWLDFKGLTSTAGSMYDWALDIAAGALPQGAGHVVDIKTGIINRGHEEFVTENLLMATTAMGVHYAKMGDVKQALPIFLSVLRARRSLPIMPTEENKTSTREVSPVSPESQFGAYFTAVKDMLIDAPYPKPPASGNERPYHDMKEACEEVGVMTYIGEILFATSDQEREKGLSWTRDSVGAAEAVLWVMEEKNRHDEKAQKRCRECLETGLENWRQMARQMIATAKSREQDIQKSGGWLGLGIGKDSAVRKAQNDIGRWREEETQIKLMKEKTASLLSS